MADELSIDLSTDARARERRAAQFVKLDHLGEFIAINIYSAQLRVCRVTAPMLLPLLEHFLAHEQRHLAIFAGLLAERRIARCRAFGLLGLGGSLLGFVTALFGKSGVMACTAAVETVVLGHLDHQLAELRASGDTHAVAAIESILHEEVEHRDTGVTGGEQRLVYRALYALVAPATAAVIATGMLL
jgi:ubiquinone biosynthesis monooxygenase Coq7